MSFEPRIGPEGRDDDVTRGLRRLYAPPAGDAYWQALGRRIMARVAAEGDGWWQPLAHWAGVGVVAAALALLFAGVALQRSRDAESQLAYQTIIETPRSTPLQIATDRGAGPNRDATLRYVISP